MNNFKIPSDVKYFDFCHFIDRCVTNAIMMFSMLGLSEIIEKSEEVSFFCINYSISREM